MGRSKFIFRDFTVLLLTSFLFKISQSDELKYHLNIVLFISLFIYLNVFDTAQNI